MRYRMMILKFRMIKLFGIRGLKYNLSSISENFSPVEKRGRST